MASPADIPALVRRLRSPRRLEQVQAAEALAPLLAGDPAAVQALVDAGGGAVLARMVVSGSSNAAQRAAARALNAATTTVATLGDHAAAQFAGQAAGEVGGSIPVLVTLLRGSDSQVQEAAACLVYIVAVSSQEQRSAVVNAGGPTALLACLRQLSLALLVAASASARAKEYCSGYCAAALAVLCESSCVVQRAVAAAGGAALLVNLLSSSSPLVQLGAAQALQGLAAGCPEGQQAAAAAGAIPALAQLLADGTDQDTNIAAVKALLALYQHWSADVQQVAGSIPGLVRILQHSTNRPAQQAAHSILYCIYDAGGLPQLRAMAAAGAAPALQRLLTAHRQDKAAAELVSKASTLLDALNRLPQCFAPGECASGSQDRNEQGEHQEFTGAEAPLAPAAPTTPARPPRVCAAPGCGATRGLKRCGGCGTVRYCSEACSRVHWREHRAECRRLQAERAAAGGAPVQP